MNDNELENEVAQSDSVNANQTEIAASQAPRNDENASEPITGEATSAEPVVGDNSPSVEGVATPVDGVVTEPKKSNTKKIVIIVAIVIVVLGLIGGGIAFALTNIIPGFGDDVVIAKAYTNAVQSNHSVVDAEFSITTPEGFGTGPSKLNSLNGKVSLETKIGQNLDEEFNLSTTIPMGPEGSLPVGVAGTLKDSDLYLKVDYADAVSGLGASKLTPNDFNDKWVKVSKEFIAKNTPAVTGSNSIDYEQTLSCVSNFANEYRTNDDSQQELLAALIGNKAISFTKVGSEGDVNNYALDFSTDVAAYRDTVKAIRGTSYFNNVLGCFSGSKVANDDFFDNLENVLDPNYVSTESIKQYLPKITFSIDTKSYQFTNVKLGFNLGNAEINIDTKTIFSNDGDIVINAPANPVDVEKVIEKFGPLLGYLPNS
jgi:hypothetical protein